MAWSKVVIKDRLSLEQEDLQIESVSFTSLSGPSVVWSKMLSPLAKQSKIPQRICSGIGCSLSAPSRTPPQADAWAEAITYRCLCFIRRLSMSPPSQNSIMIL